MFLFIFESIGTSELLLIGIVALIFLGPRRMPEMARKVGKMMSEFRGTANEFKDTWKREVDFEEEVKALDIRGLENEPVERAKSIYPPQPQKETPAPVSEPQIKPVDEATLARLKAQHASDNPTEAAAVPATPVDPNDKQNWL